MFEDLKLLAVTTLVAFFAVFIMVIVTWPGLSAIAKTLIIAGMLLLLLPAIAFFCDEIIVLPLPSALVRWIRERQNRRGGD